jgi:GR25 family glycosyltransferase involved in LPS biosynthesis
MATLRFLPSLHHLLSGVSQQRRVFDQLEVHVWLSSDISEEIKENLQTTFPIATFHRLPEDKKPEGFADFWDPQHFAWKLWILNHVSETNLFEGRMVLYMDAGIFLSRWPKTWLQIADEEGISVLEDPRQRNEQWCHAAFCKALDVTPTESISQQIWAGCLAFKGGNAKAKALFAEAFQWSTKREVIVGPKWEGVRDGKPYGHRHDQSILSILTQRMGIVRYPMDEIYCDVSLRKTFQTGKSLYVHRGAFTLHKPFLEGIDEVFVVNLDKRADRMEKLYANCPELKGRVNRLSAVNGRELALTPAIARLFKPHDFFWKKAILGCALSHLSLWWDLVHEKPEIKTYLILEDDVKFKPEWEAKWNEAVGYVPDDADVIYLGGILPPNRAGFETVKEKVNQYFSRVAPNVFFGQKPASRYFHWCNYAYILTRRGAEKVLEIMQEQDGYWTSGDHMVCNRVDKLNHYFLDPLVAGCYQDDDPKYQGSAFNDFSRVDGFDSDLWNNDDRFPAADVAEALKEMEGKPYEIHTALSDTKKPKTAAVQAPVVAQAPEVVVGQDTTAKKLVQEFLAERPKVSKRRFVTLEEHKFDGANAYEREWVQELLGKDTPFCVEAIPFSSTAPSDAPIVLVQRPHLERYTALLQRWNTQGKDFYVFHLSDEYRDDSLEIYSLEHCLGVVRIYQRNDIPVAVKDKVVTIPLGYHWTLALGSDNPMDKTPRLPFRNVLWSFFGTGWQDREKLLEPLMGIQPHTLKVVDSWDSPEKLIRGQYIASLLDTVFVPCPPGNNLETFRLYEALECGCVPVYVKCAGDDQYVEWLQNELGLLPVSSWAEAAALMVHFFKEKELLENYRNSMLIRWKNWKERLGTSVKKQWNL